MRSNFFSFSSLRWWGSPQTSTWTWKQIAALPEPIKTDLSRVDSSVPRRIDPLRTATRGWVRVNLRCTVEGND